MNRQRWLLVIIVVLALAKAWNIYAEWGLITVDVKDAPLAKVMHSIEKQGWVTLATNMPADTKVTMHVFKVPLPDALEALSVVTESRWRLTYVFAPDKGSIQGMLSTISANQKAEGWKSAFYPLMRQINETPYARITDPRLDTWLAKDPTEKTLQGYLDQGAQSVAASFVFPETLNPAINGKLSEGQVRNVAPKLASLAHAKVQEIFLLTKRIRRGETAENDGGGDDERMDGGRFGRGGPGGGGGGDGLFARAGAGGREAMEARVMAEIDKLPADQRAAALAEFQKRKAFFESLRDLPPDQRQAKLEEMMNNPNNQDQMQANQNAKDSQMTPDQRESRAENYMNRASSFRSSMLTK
jgi:hypothetical protein